MRIALIGKRYEDICLSVDTNTIGETNNISNTDVRLGGIHNFLNTKEISDNIALYEIGVKTAYILKDLSHSKRTSYTSTKEKSLISDNLIEELNSFSWAHFCYIDDLENIENLKNLKIPHSFDFCMNKSRSSFVQYINNAKLIFDSRERKDLYRGLDIQVPIILHDERGCEIMTKEKIECSFNCETLKNLDVNGAGDMYAKNFLINLLYKNNSLKTSTKLAMHETTEYLKNGRIL